MKKYFIFTSILLLAASCAKQPAALNPTPVPQPAPAPSPDPMDSWQTYHSLNYNFEFEYPKDFGFEQVTSSFLPDPVVELAPQQNMYAGTNYRGSSFAVSTGFTKTAVECLVNPNTKQALSETQDINGVKFYKEHLTDAAAGTRYDTDIYRTWQPSICLEIDLTVSTGNIGNYPEGTVTEVDQSKPLAPLMQMLNTFKFTK